MQRLLRRRDGARAVLAGEAAAAAAQAEASPLPIAAPAAAAFFDIDNTIMRGSSIYHFARGLAAHKVFTARDLIQFGWQQAMFRIRGTENADHIHAAREAALAFVAGQRVDELQRLSDTIYDELVADRIWPGTRALAKQHIDAGQQVWLVTAAPVEMANIIVARLGLTGALGTVAERVDGRYTGRLVGELLHGPAKAEAVRALAKREGLDLSLCSAYSDSINDRPMLSLVGYPNAVNPDPDLRDLARERGWPIYDFRTGRKATMIALPAGAGVGALAGGIAVGVALRRRHNRRVLGKSFL
ncbi:MAG: HAD-IB family hydrolase [Streptosporangiales bacterium]|nr:HAD-IB family hydrolase [Streptosporangiales bacterium]